MHQRTNAVEQERVDGAAPRQREDHAAEDRARVAVAAGAVKSADSGATASLQRLAGNAALTTALQRDRGGDHDQLDGSSVASTISSGGTPLDQVLPDGEVQQAFGGAVDGVQVHTGPDAAASTKAVGASAYTAADHIVLGDDVDPSSAAGKRTMAHELTHVVQQRAGAVDGTPVAGGVSVSDPSDRFEQEAVSNADRVVGGASAEVATAGVSGSAMTAQREVDDDHEGGDTDVQREEVPEEESVEDETPDAG